MAYEFQAGLMYRMPTHFGPSLGPRQGEDGREFVSADSHHVTQRSVSFLTSREQLEELLPKGFEVGEEPVVTVEASYMTNIAWLAGRGYNTLGVRFPAVFKGKEDQAVGSFLAVLWENLTDPILTGREELGFSKIYADIPEPRTCQGQTHCTASWMGFRFVHMELKNMTQLSPEEIAASTSKQTGDGLLHYKYIPRTGEWGKADVSYATMTPYRGLMTVVKEMWRGEGTVRFHKADWEDLPTQFNIVNAFHNLEVKEYRGAVMVKSIGCKNLRDQRILR